ncbi:SFK1 Protein SFK1 [Candida maltosa Xu316]
MLAAMLLVWNAQGRPSCWFRHRIHQGPVYISDIGATNLQPLFISCTGFQNIFFVGTLVMGWYLRKYTNKIQPYISKHQPRLALASIACAIIGQLGILFVAVFNTRRYHQVHITMVGIFIAFSCLACFCDFAISFIFGIYPEKLDPVHDQVIFGNYKTSNLYFVSFVLKLIWLLAAIAFAICFGSYMAEVEEAKSAVFEWLISFWYGLLLVLWSMDLIPSAIRKYRCRNPHLYPRYESDESQQEKGFPNYWMDNSMSDGFYDEDPTYIASFLTLPYRQPYKL